MSEDETLVLTEEPKTSNRFVLLSLVFSRFSTQTPSLLTSLLLIDIGLTFGLSVGVTAQLRTMASIVCAIGAIGMGVWSIRYNHRSLFLIGLSFLTVSAVGCSYAPTFTIILITYSIFAFGASMVGPMGLTLVGEYFPLEKRAIAAGWVNAGMSLAAIFGLPIIGFIAGVGGWRWAYLGYVLPLSIFCLGIAVYGIPSIDTSPKLMRHQGAYLEGFKVIFSNHSAVACLLGTGLFFAGWQAILVYSASFLREHFLVSLDRVSIIAIGFGVFAFLGSVVGGQVVNQIGRKPATVITALFASISFITYPNVSYLWLSVLLLYLGCIFTGLLITANSSLILEQVPSVRGSMMSLNSAAWMVGSALGTGVGGLVLLAYDYMILGLVLGTFSLVAVLVFYFLTVDPTHEDRG